MILNILSTGDAILNYHRICPDNNSSSYSDELAVSETKFKEQLIYLKKNYKLVCLDELLNFKKDNKPKVSITFDDGYKDNLTYAMPILTELNVPATIYVVTKSLKRDLMPGGMNYKIISGKIRKTSSLHIIKKITILRSQKILKN